MRRNAEKCPVSAPICGYVCNDGAHFPRPVAIEGTIEPFQKTQPFVPGAAHVIGIPRLPVLPVPWEGVLKALAANGQHHRIAGNSVGNEIRYRLSSWNGRGTIHSTCRGCHGTSGAKRSHDGRPDGHCPASSDESLEKRCARLLFSADRAVTSDFQTLVFLSSVEFT